MTKGMSGCCAAFGLAVLVLAGCETGRVNKTHAVWEHANDVSTTSYAEYSQSNPTYMHGVPPVPGSPTAAGKDGLQPVLDSEARPSPGAEDALPARPERQVYRFVAQ